MKSFVKFFVDIGKLRKIPRRGGVLIGSANPPNITDHLFRVAIMAWVLAREKRANLNISKVLTMALAHDLCELYTGDQSPYDYDSALPRDKKKWPELFDTWPRFSKAEKEKMAVQKHKDEEKALNLVIKVLPKTISQEIKNSWLEYGKGLTREARFVKQINRLETLLQALEHGKEEKIRVYKSWWIGTEERVDDPLLLRFVDALRQEFSIRKKSRK